MKNRLAVEKTPKIERLFKKKTFCREKMRKIKFFRYNNSREAQKEVTKNMFLVKLIRFIGYVLLFF